MQTHRVSVIAVLAALSLGPQAHSQPAPPRSAAAADGAADAKTAQGPSGRIRLASTALREPPGKDAMSLIKDPDWQRAEAIARQYLAKRKRKSLQIEPAGQIPYLFNTISGDQYNHVLVSKESVVIERGLSPLGSYWHALDAQQRSAFQALEMLQLIEVLAALPPVKAPASPAGYYSTPRPDAPLSALNPQLHYQDGETRFVLSYLLSRPVPPNQGSVAEPQLVRLARWTLKITANRPPFWQEERLTFDPQTNHFLGET